MAMNKGGRKLSLSMIVKNEEKFLEDCLRSVEGVVDEMVIVDTGSTDRSRDIAERFGARVFSWAWSGDFSAARNECLRHVSGDWVLYMDADERLESGHGKALRSLMRHPSAGAFLIYVGGTIALQNGRYGHSNAYPRLFRRHPNIGFEGKVHEQIAPSIERLGMPILPSTVVVRHLGYGQSVEITMQKSRRNISLLRVQLDESPDDAYARFQLGNSLTMLKEFPEARLELERAKASPILPPSIQANISNLLAEIDVNEGKFDDAIGRYRKSLRLAPMQKMARWFMGGVLMNLRRFPEALPLLKELTRSSVPPHAGMDIAFDLTLEPAAVYYRLGICHQEHGDARDAEEAYVASLWYKPAEAAEIVERLSQVYQMQNDALSSMRRCLDLRAKGMKTYHFLLYVAQLLWNAGRKEEALRVLREARLQDPKHKDSYDIEATWRAGEDLDLLAREAEAHGVVSFELDRTVLKRALRENDLAEASRRLSRMVENVPEGVLKMKEQLISLQKRLSLHTGQVLEPNG